MPPVPAPEERRQLFVDPQPGDPEGSALGAEERFVPFRGRKGLTSGEHFARYLFAAGYCAGKRVLDLACGSGYGARLLKLLGAAAVTGVDRDTGAIEFAERAFGGEGLRFVAGEAAGLALEEPPFEVVVSFETLEHVADPGAFLEAVRRHLAPGGLFLVSCPHDARSPWVSPFHVRHYTYAEFREVVARHFPDPVPVAQIHGIASLVLPLEQAAADDLTPAVLERAYLDVGKPVEDSDVFLLLCGPAAPPQPVAVLTKNLSELLQEVYGAAAYLRERTPRLEADLAETQGKLERANRQLAAVRRALDQQKQYTVELQDNLDAMQHSRTWQLMLACREALGSAGALLRLPGRVAKILTHTPAPPDRTAPGRTAPRAILPQYWPHRRSTVQGWPADRPLVTVGIPCYNYGRFVREAVDSVLASTFQDFEIIVVNDGSTEAETLGVLAELEKSPPDPRVRVVHQENQGLAATRNKGAALGRGKYVVSLDADDRMTPTYLEKTLGVLEHCPEYAFCYSLVQMFGAEEEVWKTEPFDLEKALRYNHVPTAAVFRKEAWVEAGGFRDELYGQDDWNFWITLGAKGWEGRLIEEPLFDYRKHHTSMWSGLQMEARARTAERIRGLHGYLVGRGDERMATEFCPPQDPVVRAALDAPEPPPGPGRAFEERRHLAFGNGKPALLFAVPWMAVGGSEQVVLQVMEGLAGEYNLAAVSTLDAPHTWEAEFRRLTPWIYHLGVLPLEDPAAYLRDLIRAHGIRGMVVSSSALAYQALPLLKRDLDLWTADIVHNVVAEGYLATSIRQDAYLDCHFAVGGPQREALVKKGGVPEEKVRLAPTAADAQRRFHPATYAARLPEIRRRLGLKGGEVVLTYTGRLSVEKDVPLFVRVVGELARRHPEKRFQGFIAGDGPELGRVEQEIRRQGLQGAVELLGFCDYVPEVLAVSRFAFLTSKFEGSSITVLEAMSMGQVVFTTDAGNVRDVIEDGQNGFIIPSREPEDFAARVSEVLADPARETAIRERARQTIVDRFDLAAMVRVYAEAAGEALMARRQPA